jgi:hypothetical protein
LPDTAVRRGSVLAERLTAAKASIAEERAARQRAERENEALQRELAAIEASTFASGDERASTGPSRPRLDRVALLYICGRPHHIAHLRALSEDSGGTFLHHDGSNEHHLNLLAGLASQANLVVFPVDCISHHAARVAKQLCRQSGKQFIPLRSASVTSLLPSSDRRCTDWRMPPTDSVDAHHHIGRLDDGRGLHARLQLKFLRRLVGDRCGDRHRW